MRCFVLCLLAAIQMLSCNSELCSGGIDKLLDQVIHHSIPLTKNCFSDFKESHCNMRQLVKGVATTVKVDVREQGVFVVMFSDSKHFHDWPIEELNRHVFLNTIQNSFLNNLKVFISRIECYENKRLCQDILGRTSNGGIYKSYESIAAVIHKYCTKSVTSSSVYYMGRLSDVKQLLMFKGLERLVEIQLDSHQIQLSVKSNLNDLATGNIKTSYHLVYVPLRPVTTSAYFRQFNYFLAATQLLDRSTFSFQVLTNENKTADMKATLQLFSEQACRGDLCRPLNQLLPEDAVNTNQMVSFVLYTVLQQNDVLDGFPILNDISLLQSPTVYQFLTSCNTYIISTDTVPTNSLVELVHITQSQLKQKVFPLFATKEFVENGLLKMPYFASNRLSITDKLFYLIRLSDSGNKFAYFSANRLVKDILSVLASRSDFFGQLTLDAEEYRLSLKDKDGNRPHPHGLFSAIELSFEDADDEDKNKGSRFGGGDEAAFHIAGRVDAFVEQFRTKDVYNVSHVLCIEANSSLRDNLIPHIKSSNTPWLVLYVVSWNPVCKAARTILSAVSQCINQYRTLQVAKVDCFEMNKHCESQGIHRYPTVVLYHNDGRSPVIYNSTISVNQMCAFGVSLSRNVIIIKDEDLLNKEIGTYTLLLDYVFIIRGQPTEGTLSELSKYSNHVFLYCQYSNVATSTTLSVKFSNKFVPDRLTFEGDLSDFSALSKFVSHVYLNTIFPLTIDRVSAAISNNKSIVCLSSAEPVSNKLNYLEPLFHKFASQSVVFAHDNFVSNEVPSLFLLRVVNSEKQSVDKLVIGNASDVQSWLTNKLQSSDTSKQKVDIWIPAHEPLNLAYKVYHGKISKSNKKKSSDEEDEFRGNDSDGDETERKKEDSESVPHSHDEL